METQTPYARLVRKPLTCMVPEGIACTGGCHFKILRGHHYWPGAICTFCEASDRTGGQSHA